MHRSSSSSSSSSTTTLFHPKNSHQSLYHLQSTALTGLMSPFPELNFQHLSNIHHARSRCNSVTDDALRVG